MTDELALVFPAAVHCGGVERVALDVLTRLAARHQVAFIGERLDQGSADSIRFRQVSARKGWRHPRAFRAAAQKELARERPDTLMSFGVNCPPGDVYWVHSVHRAWVQSGSAVRVKGVAIPAFVRRLLPRHRVLLRLEKDYFCRHRPRAILCTSQREVDDLATLYAVSRDVMHVVPNGFDASRFNPADRSCLRSAVRAELGVADSDISILFIVNELHRKGFTVLLEALALVADRRLRVDLVGRADPAPFAGMIDRLGLTGRVFWHGSTDTVERFHAAGDLLVLPTQYEPFGLVIIEALASGLPVITTALAGAAAAVSPDVGLLQQDPHDAQELADLLRQALQPGALERWGAAAPAAAAPYEWDAVLRGAEPLIFGTTLSEGLSETPGTDARGDS